ncbi:MAG: hypothetical protein WBN30_12005, partial [Polyangiales bacterium]
TGPIARGESEVVSNHRAALRDLSPDALAAYDSVVPIIVRCARAAGLGRTKASEILRITKR